MRFRLILSEGDAATNMAIDETLLILRALDVIPDTIRLYVFKPSAVTIGYFQSVAESVNLDYLREKGIAFVRRPTGGGSVYHDSGGEVTYSVVVKESLVPDDYVESFKLLASGVVEAARLLGVPAEFRPINDIVVDGRKFSGQAQVRRLGAVLQHGTVMYDTNLEVLASTLRAPGPKLAVKGVKSIRERVITLSEYLGRKLTKEEVIKALIEGFRRGLGADLVKSQLTPYEVSLARSLRWKYVSREWNFMRP